MITTTRAGFFTSLFFEVQQYWNIWMNLWAARMWHSKWLCSQKDMEEAFDECFWDKSSRDRKNMGVNFGAICRCGFILRDEMCLEPVSLMFKKGRLRWFGHAKRKHDNDWVKHCITLVLKELDRRQKKTWLDCVKDDAESLGLSQKDAQYRNKWRRRIKGATG